MIRAQSIRIFRAERKVIRDFSLDIEPGKTVAILGPNGSGKSTLLGALSGDIAIAGGSISINKSLIDTYSIRELAKIRTVSAQHQRFPLAFTVYELLEMSRRFSGDKRSEEDAIAALDIQSLLARKVTSLSGGEQQRVGIAMALAQDTPYIFLDEPFAAQDLESTARIAQHLQTLASGGRAIVIVAHMTKSELAWCDQIIRIKAL